jgi:Zinc finger, C3HC4 type (RING finger)
MACHPDLVLRSKTNATQFVQDASEATVCRLCNDVAEDAIQSKCRHIFDRECIKQYLESTFETNVSYRFLFYFSFTMLNGTVISSLLVLSAI